jgi:hypothetical protein
LSGPGIKVPCREPWENKSFKRRKTLHGNQEESRQEKETLSGPMLVQKFPKASQEKHLLRGFSSWGKGAGFALAWPGEDARRSTNGCNQN